MLRISRHYLDLLVVTTHKELVTRYKQAVLGSLWMLLEPLLNMLIIGTVFSFFIRIPNYYLFLLTGLLPWQFISNTLNKTTGCYVSERTLLQKAVFPREIIPLSIIMANFIRYGVAQLVLIVFLTATFGLNPEVFWIIPATSSWFLIITTGLSLTTASLNVRYRDIVQVVQAGLTIWFYASPVVYSLAQVPPGLHYLFYLNPLTTPLSLLHRLTGTFVWLTPSTIIASAGVAVGLMLLGIFVFRRESPRFVDWI